MFANTTTNDDFKGGVAASPYGHTTTPNEDTPWVTKKQPTRCRDPLFAVLLVANVAAIVGVFFKYGMDALNVEQEPADDEQDYTGFVKLAGALAGISAVLSAVMLQVLICIPGFLIKAALFFNVLLAAAMAAWGFYMGSIIMGVIGLVFLALMVCYVRAVWSRIPFATANLKTGCSAISANYGVILVAYFFTVLAVGWTVLWSLAVVGVQDTLYECDEDGVCSNPNYGYLFLLFLSLFFTQQVIQNCVHTTVSGVVGSWWFTPENSGCCSSAICGSFFRTMTTSFGSICFGSLLVAIIQAVRQLAETARQNEEYGQLLACCIDCILGCLESILEYFNKWAFTYVGIYGYGYCEAGKSVIELFKDRGWEAIIADNLVDMALNMTALVVGLICIGVSIGLEKGTDWLEEFPYEPSAVQAIAGVMGFIVGILICSIVMGVISSSVNATIVLFADAPAEFESKHPELSREMRETYLAAYPGCM